MRTWRFVLLTAAAAGTIQAQSATPSVLGSGWGLDHVLVAMPNANAAKEMFGAKLGFSVIPGIKFPTAGLEQATVRLPPAYLEFLWRYQDPTVTRADPSLLRRKQETGGGPGAYNLDVSPVDGAADAMRRLGMKVTLPPSITRIVNGKEERGRNRSVLTSPEDQQRFPSGVPGGEGVGFIEYPNNEERLKPEYAQMLREQAERETPDVRRLPGEIHANTARKLRSVWVAVASVAEAVKQSQRFGFAPGAERQLTALGARGREVECGQGTIVFWESTKDGGALSELIKTQGLGPFGVSIGVADLGKAHQIAEQGMQAKLPIEGKRSFLVPAEMASGTWIEFVQQ